jgi:hypothetical protein
VPRRGDRWLAWRVVVWRVGCHIQEKRLALVHALLDELLTLC